MDTWIADNFSVLADRRLDQLTMPGTHDSAAYRLASPLSPGPLSPSARDLLLWIASTLGRPFVAPWTLTQHCSIYRQLAEAGIRFLDIRVSWERSKKRFIASHTFACVPLAKVLADVTAFLNAKGHECEVVVMCLRPDWPHRAPFKKPDRIAALLQEISSAAAGMLYPRSSLLPTLRQMVACDRRLLAFVEGVPLPAAQPAPVPAAAPAPVQASEPKRGQGQQPTQKDQRESKPDGMAAGDRRSSGGRRGRFTLQLTAWTGDGASPCTAVGAAAVNGDNSSSGGGGGSGKGAATKSGSGSGEDTDDTDVWLCAGCRTIWADSDTPAGTLEGLLRIIAQMRRDGCLPRRTSSSTAPKAVDPEPVRYWYVSAAVTPTAGSVARALVTDPWHAGLRSAAAQFEAEQLPALLEEGLRGVGAVCLDHPSPEAVRAVVKLNLRREAE